MEILCPLYLLHRRADYTFKRSSLPCLADKATCSTSQLPPKDGPGWCLISPAPGLPELLLSQQLAWLRQGPSLLPIASAWIDPHLRAILRIN